nr:ABC transporter ATP-binding protein [Nereida sp. MMG025]
MWGRFLRQHRGKLIIAFILMAIEGSMLGLLSYMLQPMFDTVFVGGDRQAAYWVGGVIFGIFAVRAVTTVGQRALLTQIAQKTEGQIKSDLAQHLMRLDMGFHQKNPPGYLIERVQGDVLGVNQVWMALVTGAGRDAVALIALLAVVLSIDWVWTLVALIGLPLMIVPSQLMQKFVRRKSTNAREVAASMSTRLDEIFHGIAPIKLNRLEDYQDQRYRGLITTRVRVEVEAAIGRAMMSGLADLIAGIGFFAVLIYGANDIISGEKTIGQFMSFFTAMGFAFEPLRRLAGLAGIWQTAAAGIERLQDLFETDASQISRADAITDLPDAIGNITLSDVDLLYGDAPVLNGLSFTAEAGKTTALVGASGAGKSTVFNLLTRLNDPVKGAVTIGGTDITSVDLGTLRSLYSVVTQDAMLFDETIRENILLGRKDISEEALQAALEAAFVTDFLPSLERGLDTQAGPRGSALSGGQRQRVAIARALLRDTPILLLDEATSALDTRSEQMVQAALDKLSTGRTTLVIAHRLSTIQQADKIIVMDAGRVVEEGSHTDLLAKGGAYAALHAAQFSEDTA